MKIRMKIHIMPHIKLKYHLKFTKITVNQRSFDQHQINKKVLQ